MYNLKDKIVLITGASSGIGAETALEFARTGAKVVITYKENKLGAEEIEKQIVAMGGEILVIQAELIQEQNAKNVVEQIIQKFEKLDILVNNAGRYIDGDEWNGSAEIWTKSLEQNLVSVMNMSKYAIELFQIQKSGVIVNISSRFSAQGQYDSIAYGAAKAGIVNITQAYAKLLAPFGRVNAISPGVVSAGYWLNAPEEELKDVLINVPLQKFIEPKEIADLVLFFSSEKAKNITGQNIFVDGGYSLK